MHHPFALNLADLVATDLEFEEELTEAESEQVAAGLRVTTLALGEEGGILPKPICPPVTTHALGEEGGYITQAKGEAGGHITRARREDGGEPITTLAIGEEGGSWTM